MTSLEFNNKYEKYLEEGHYGLDIDNLDVVEYLDKLFEEELTKIKGFQYSQIKTKFGMARFYCEPYGIDTSEIEDKINKLLGRKDESIGY